MQEYMTIRETAGLWGISARRISALCKGGRVDGAMLFGGVWAIPKGTPKPYDARIKSGKYIKNNENRIVC